MELAETKDVVAMARRICEKTGSRLTETRQHMLEVLSTADTPMSAYELTEYYNQLIEAPIMAMSVYRILDFLESIRLVHRLHSINKYIICSHSTGSREYQPLVFMICTSCQHIEEVEITAELVKALSHHAENVGFVSTGSQIEFNSLCEKCNANIHPHSHGDFHDQDSTNQ